jgi:hypothetical protein
MNIAATVLVVVLALVFFTLGSAKIMALAFTRELAAHVRFSTTAYRGIGTLEAAGAIGLLIGIAQPLLGAAAGIGLLLLLGGALVAHLRVGDGPREYAPAVATGILVVTYLALLFGATR